MQRFLTAAVTSLHLWVGEWIPADVVDWHHFGYSLNQ